MNKLQSVCFLVVLFLTANVNAQNTEIGNWFLYFGNQKINNRWNWHNEVQYRNYNFAGDLEQLLLRTGIGYNLTENNNNVLLGYAYVHSEPYIAGTDEKTNTNEHRIFQQFITKEKFGRVNIQHRYRFEQRFIEDNFKMRARYLLSLNFPINKKEMDKNAIYASAYNEIFINTEPNYFDRDRIYGGVGYCFNKNFKIEAGVMTQILSNSSRTQFQIMFFNSLPF
jgi:long-subunit fatty acid transport protein